MRQVPPTCIRPGVGGDGKHGSRRWRLLPWRHRPPRPPLWIHVPFQFRGLHRRGDGVNSAEFRYVGVNGLSYLF